MPSMPLRVSKAVASLLLTGRETKKLTIQEVEDITALMGERIPHSTLARIESGKLDPGVVRLQVLMSVYDISSAFVLSLVLQELKKKTKR